MKKHKFLLYAFVIATNVCYMQEHKFNENFTIACHNCFERQFAERIEDVFVFTTTIEIDIWDTKIWFGLGGWKAMDGDWYVRHFPTDDGNINCCGGTLRDCLLRLKDWSDQNPDHNIITVFIDKKENWSDPNETRKPQDLDNLLLSIFSNEKIYTPKFLLKDKENLKVAVENNNWATLDSLRGKLAFIVTDGTVITTRKPLNEYLSQNNNPVCFVAPEIYSEHEINLPEGFSLENSSNVVFYNLHYANRNLAKNINTKKCLSRVYGSPETIESLHELKMGKVNFIALDNYKLEK